MDTLLYFDRWVLRYLLNDQPGDKHPAAYRAMVGRVLKSVNWTGESVGIAQAAV